MARHVDEMAGADDIGGLEPVGGQFGAARIAARLDQVDIEMLRLGMAGAARQHRLDQPDRLADPVLGRAPVRLPIVPGPCVHRRFGGDHCDVVVGREARGGGEHRIGIAGLGWARSSPA